MEKYISSDRILLRTIKESDVGAILSYRSLDEVARYQYWEPFTEDMALTFVNQCSNTSLDKRDKWIGLAIIYRDNDTLIGDCALNITGCTAEIGCNLSPEYQNKGFAREALSLLVDYCFQIIGVEEIIGITDSENITSVKLMQSLGMERCFDFEEKVFCKGQWCIEHKYYMKSQLSITKQ